MKCIKCNNQIETDINSCSGCGLSVKNQNQPTNDSEKSNSFILQKSKNKSYSIISILAFVIAFILGRFIGVVIFLFVGAVILGLWFPKWYMSRGKVNQKLIKFIAGFNILTWLIPPLGMLTACLTLKFSEYLPEKRKRYKIIAYSTITISLINAVVGVLIRL